MDTYYVSHISINNRHLKLDGAYTVKHISDILDSKSIAYTVVGGGVYIDIVGEELFKCKLMGYDDYLKHIIRE